MSSVRATCWSVTINNPTKDDEDDLSRARSISGWRVEGQLEKGENGTPHYQLLVKTPQVRFAALKKAFPRAHIEVARNPAALKNYVAKEETREGDLPAPDNKYPSLNKYWDMIYAKFNTGNKDGWDWCDDRRVKFYSDTLQKWIEADPLDWLDEVTGDFIDEGYFVEHHVCNPAVRSAWKRFHSNILFRARKRHDEKVAADRQTDSQCGESQEVNIPTINITNANDNSRESPGLSRPRWFATCEDDESDNQGQSEETGTVSESGSDECSEASDGTCD